MKSLSTYKTIDTKHLDGKGKRTIENIFVPVKKPDLSIDGSKGYSSDQGQSNIEVNDSPESLFDSIVQCWPLDDAYSISRCKLSVNVVLKWE